MDATPAPYRIEWLDVLRGVAVAGMLLVHIGKQPQGGGIALERWHEAFDFLAVGKFYAIFALLFGIGFGLYAEKRKSDASPAVGFLRRLASLAIIMAGLKLLFASSLLYYAIWGVPLVFMRRLSSWWLSATIVALLCFQSFLMAPGAAPEAILGTFLMWADPGLRGPFVLSLFIIGLLAVRHGVVRDAAGHRMLLAGVVLGGIAVALAAEMLSLWWVPQFQEPVLNGSARRGFGLIRTEWLGVSYAAGFVLLCTGYNVRRFMAPLVWVGRASLSNYALHLLVLKLLFARWALGVSLDWRLGVVVAALSFAMMAALSAWWFRHYKQGPLEWLWRSMSDGDFVPIQRVSRAAAR